MTGCDGLSYESYNTPAQRKDTTDSEAHTETKPQSKEVDYRLRPLGDEIIYHIMTDRFENGDPSNDRGGEPSTISSGGFDPSSPTHYQGGDFKGILAHLDYIENLGATALWLSPIFAGRSIEAPTFPVANYHGFGMIDFLNVDPHLGSNADFKQLIDAVHARNMKLYIDVTFNHTGNVITYPDCLDECPFRDSHHEPYTPQLIDDAWATVKNPAWLNDLSIYNNRGRSNISWGIDDRYMGDFLAYDDINTKLPQVQQGFVDVIKYWIDNYQIDGFRIDTVTHVEMSFWQYFAPRIREYAASKGLPNFALIGEIADPVPSIASRFTKEGMINSAFDFTFASVIRRSFAENHGAAEMFGVIGVDDMYIDADTQPDQLALFASAFDFGRMGYFIQQFNQNENDAMHLKRLISAYAVTLFSRGAGIIYYGDEQGFTGDGDDIHTRAPMFPALAEEYRNDRLIGTDATPAEDNFNPGHVMYQTLQKMVEVRKAHQALRTGIHQNRFADSGTGIYAFSRYLWDKDAVEYLVIANSATTQRSADIQASTASAIWQSLYCSDGANPTLLISNETGRLQATQAAMSLCVYRANRAILDSTAGSSTDFSVDVAKALSGETQSRLVQISSQVSGQTSPVAVSFWIQVDGGEFAYYGTDYTEPYRVYYDSGDNVGPSDVTVRVVAKSLNGLQAQDEVAFKVDNRPIKQARIHYQNGNGRQFMVLQDQNGTQYGPFSLEDNASPVIVFSTSPEWLHLFFFDREGDTFSFDQPLRLKVSTQVMPLVEADGSEWQLALYIANDHRVDNQPIESSALPEILEQAPNATAQIDADNLYVRGSVNNWQTTGPFQYLGDNSYRVIVQLPQSTSSIKFGDPVWRSMDFGAPIDKDGYSASLDAMIFDVPEGAAYEIFLFDKPVSFTKREQFHLLLPYEPDFEKNGYLFEAHYVRGVNGDWVSTDQHNQLVHIGNSVYEVDMAVEAGEHIFKIATQNWEQRWGDAVLSMGEKTELFPTPDIGNDATMTINEDGVYRFRFEASDADTRYLTVEPVVETAE